MYRTAGVVRELHVAEVGASKPAYSIFVSYFAAGRPNESHTWQNVTGPGVNSWANLFIELA